METAQATMNLMGDEIGELRKYIVEMMRAERELMESIKLNESNVAAANVRIKQLKELISQERVRYKTLKTELAGDMEDVKILEEKQIVAEAKHRQFQDDVAQRESEVQELRTRFQQQRAAMLSLRRQVMDATTRLEQLSSRSDFVDEEMRDVTSALEKRSEPTEQCVARQKLRAKIRYTQQFIVQMEEETGQLVERRTKLEAEVLQCEQEAHKLRESVFVKEQETEMLFGRLRQDTLRTIRENGKIEGKLKAKRRKFRLKTKNEISSLKRRISFISSELERGQMANEDVLSSIDALSAKREELGQKLSERNEDLAAVEGTIAELSESIGSLSRGEENYDTANLQEQLTAKREDAQVVQEKLDQKQNFLQLLEADQTQLNATLEDISAQIVAAKETAAKMDNEITSLAKDIEEQEARSSSLRASVNDTKKKNDDLLAEYQEHQRKKKSKGKTQAKLRRQQDSLLKQEQELASELREAENLSRMLGEGIQHGMEYAGQVKESSALGESKEKRIEFELRRRELSLQQQCAHDEAKFQAEVAAWDDKIKQVEQQLGSL